MKNIKMIAMLAVMVGCVGLQASLSDKDKVSAVTKLLQAQHNLFLQESVEQGSGVNSVVLKGLTICGETANIMESIGAQYGDETLDAQAKLDLSVKFAHAALAQLDQVKDLYAQTQRDIQRGNVNVIQEWLGTQEDKGEQQAKLIKEEQTKRDLIISNIARVRAIEKINQQRLEDGADELMAELNSKKIV